MNFVFGHTLLEIFRGAIELPQASACGSGKYCEIWALAQNDAKTWAKAQILVAPFNPPAKAGGNSIGFCKNV